MRKLQLCAVLLTVVTITILVCNNFTGITGSGTDISIGSESSVTQDHRENNNHLSELFAEQHEDKETPAQITYSQTTVTTTSPTTTSPAEDEEVVGQEPLCYSVEAFRVENARRAQHMRDNCKREQSYHDVYPHILTNINEWFHFRNEHLAWCPVYKSASSWTIAHFCRKYNSPSRCQGHTTAAVFRKIPYWKAGPTSDPMFIITREPFGRLTSAYRDKVENYGQYRDNTDAFTKMMIARRQVPGAISEYEKKKQARLALDWWGRPDTYPKPGHSNPYTDPPYPTIREYVAAIVADEWRNEHICPQTQYCGPCKTRELDYVVKQENYHCEMDVMLRLVTGKGMDEGELSAGNRHAGPATSEDTMFSYLASVEDSDMDKLLEYYREDCLFFEYDCSGLVKRLREFKSRHPGIKPNYKGVS